MPCSFSPFTSGSPATMSCWVSWRWGSRSISRSADAVARVASCQVAFRYGKDIVVSTLLPNQQQELAAHTNLIPARESLNSEEIKLGGEVFLATSLELAPTVSLPVTLTVLKSYDAETRFLQELNRLLLGVGLVAVLAGSMADFSHLRHFHATSRQSRFRRTRSGERKLRISTAGPQPRRSGRTHRQHSTK